MTCQPRTPGGQDGAFAALQQGVRAAFPTACTQVQPPAPAHPGGQAELRPVLPPALGMGLLAQRLAQTAGI